VDRIAKKNENGSVLFETVVNLQDFSGEKVKVSLPAGQVWPLKTKGETKKIVERIAIPVPLNEWAHGRYDYREYAKDVPREKTVDHIRYKLRRLSLYGVAWDGDKRFCIRVEAEYHSV